ncbi:hypothetical protein ACOME3_001339 [Neoechinorhynchus agilis]
MGTSLSVQPFSSTHIELCPEVPRILINKSRVSTPWARVKVPDGDCPDVFMKTTCDQGITNLLHYAGYGDQFERFYAAEFERARKLSLDDMINIAKLH